jgi:hypothetical protein
MYFSIKNNTLISSYFYKDAIIILKPDRKVYVLSVAGGAKRGLVIEKNINAVRKQPPYN